MKLFLKILILVTAFIALVKLGGFDVIPNLFAKGAGGG